MSKIGTHSVIGPRKNFGEYLKAIVDAGQPIPMIKCVDDFGPAQEAKDLDPNTLTVGRQNKGRDENGNEVDLQAIEPVGKYEGSDGAIVAATDYYKIAKRYWDLNPQIDIWETFNEFSFHWDWQGMFYIAMMDLAEKDGYILSHYCCSSGNPPNDTAMSAMIPCLQEAKRRGHYLSLHEYGGVGTDIKTLKGTQPYHALRYRDLYNRILIPNNANPLLLLTEIGQAGGFDFLGTEILIDDITWYDKELAADDYIKGAAIFTLGNWYQSNYQDALPALAQYTIDNPSPTPPDPPTIPPEPDECKPRTPYNRVYHWVDIKEANEVKDAVWEIAKQTGGTVGSSADDALFGPNLGSVKGIFYNLPEDEHDAYIEFRDRDYPKSTIEFATVEDTDPDPPIPPPSTSHPLVGVSIAIDGRHTTEAGYAALKLAKVDTIKISTLSSFEEMDRLATIVPDISKWTMRLYMAGDSDQLGDPETFYKPQRAHIAKFRDMGGRDLEIHNEPQHPNEGMGTAWQNEQQFLTWYKSVVGLIRDEYPQMQIGFPGLWPNPTVDVWLKEIGDDIAQLSDIIYIHTYWQQRGTGTFGMDNPASGGRYWERFQKRFPKHRLIISECSNNHPSLSQVSYSTRGHELKDYMTGSNWPAKMEAIFPYILELAGDQHIEQQWATPGNPIPSIIGGR